MWLNFVFQADYDEIEKSVMT